jgi:hypothetical protein
MLPERDGLLVAAVLAGNILCNSALPAGQTVTDEHAFCQAVGAMHVCMHTQAKQVCCCS